MEIKLSSIKNWAKEDRPREKMLAQGPKTLSNAELIAILLGSGNAKDSAVDLSKKILAKASNNLHELGKMSINNLQQFRGIGQAKAVTIVSAMELARRRQTATPTQRNQITCSKDAYANLAPHLLDLAYEEFWVLVLDRANKVMDCVKISSGGVSGTVVDVKKIFQKVLGYSRASGIIIAHNHPSGNLEPSQADKNITEKIKKAGKVLDIEVLDHLIIAEKSYLSFLDKGLL